MGEKIKDEVVEKKEATTTQEPSQTKKEMFLAFAKNALGDGDDYGDEEKFYEGLHRHMGDLSDYRSNSMAKNDELLALFQQEPTLAKIVSDLRDGAPFMVALGRHIDRESIVPQEGDPDYEGWAKGKEERMAKLEEKRNFDKTYQENLGGTEAAIKEFAEENELDEEGIKELMELLDGFVADLFNGKISKETLAKFHKGLTADSKAQEAAELAGIAGRNAAIEAKKVEKKEGDNLPNVGGGGTKETLEKPAPSKIDKIVNSQKKRERL
jgi:hypothetical protein